MKTRTSENPRFSLQNQSRIGTQKAKVISKEGIHQRKLTDLFIHSVFLYVLVSQLAVNVILITHEFIQGFKYLQSNFIVKSSFSY